MKINFTVNVRDIVLIVCLGFCIFMGFQNHKLQTRAAEMTEQVELHERVLNAMVKQITQHEEMLQVIGQIFKKLMEGDQAGPKEFNF